jgi:hypothetical protein
MLRFVIFAVAAVIGAGSYWSSRRVRASEDDLLPWVKPGGSTAPSAVVAATGGGSGWRVSVAWNAQRMGADGDWVDLVSDTEVAAGDQVRTKADGKLMLRDDRAATVYLAGNGHLSLRATGGGTKVRCSEGLITAMASHSDIAAELRQAGAVVSSAAAFTAYCSAVRTIVHADEGETQIAHGDSMKPLDKGQVAIVASSGDITTHKLSAEVELKLDPAKVEKEDVIISGRVAPGTRVKIGATVAEVDGSGKFSVKAPLPAGESISVQATDIAGRDRTSEVAVANPKKGKPPPKKGKK